MGGDKGNTQTTFVLQIWGLKSQLGDQEGLGGKIADDDKNTILTTVKETSDWLEENGQTVTSEDLEGAQTAASPNGWL